MQKRKALARARDRQLKVEGKLRPEQVSIAAAVDPDSHKRPLIFRRVKFPRYDF